MLLVVDLIHCCYYPELLEEGKVATVYSIGPMEKGVPKAPITVLATDLMMVTHTLEWGVWEPACCTPNGCADDAEGFPKLGAPATMEELSLTC